MQNGEPTFEKIELEQFFYSNAQIRTLQILRRPHSPPWASASAGAWFCLPMLAGKKRTAKKN